MTFQDLDSSSDDDEDFVQTRKQFQQARSVSTASKKSISFFDMELTSKDDNIRNSIPFVRQITEDGKAKLEIYRPTTNPIYIYTQVRSLCDVVNFFETEKRAGTDNDTYFVNICQHHISTCRSLENTVTLKNSKASL